MANSKKPQLEDSPTIYSLYVSSPLSPTPRSPPYRRLNGLDSGQTHSTSISSSGRSSRASNATVDQYTQISPMAIGAGSAGDEEGQLALANMKSYHNIHSRHHTQLQPSSCDVNHGDDIDELSHQEDQAASYNYPVVTVLLVLIIWGFYLGGLMTGAGIDTFSLSDEANISPSEQCHDLRIDCWRLVTVQLVHSGSMHIVGNTITTLLYGFYVEAFEGHVALFLIFEAGVIFGTLGHSWATPFNGLVGCSHGTYALIGATLVHSSLAIFSKRTNCTPSHGQFSIEDETFISLMTRFFFFNAFLVTVYSVLEYCYFPTASTSYAAHICGFLTGVAVTFLLHWTNKPAVRWCSDSEMTPVPRVRTPFLWKIIILVVFSGFCLFCTMLCYHYANVWPPQPASLWWIYPHQGPTCCQDLFEIAAAQSLSLADVRSTYYCDGIILKERYKGG